jgi:hypothetical protein
MPRSVLLWLLLLVFVLRVVGQLLVVTGRVPFLPPVDQWESGLLPYPALLASQLAIIGMLATICLQFTRGRGFFVYPKKWLARPLWIFGWIYASAMVARYAIWMIFRPEERWTGDLIPVVFHLVLASFLLAVSDHHRSLDH